MQVYTVIQHALFHYLKKNKGDYSFLKFTPYDRWGRTTRFTPSRI